MLMSFSRRSSTRRAIIGRITSTDDRVGLRLIDEIGADRVMWSNDYPHQESVDGCGWTAMQEVMDAVPEADARKTLGDNARKLYKLD